MDNTWRASKWMAGRSPGSAAVDVAFCDYSPAGPLPKRFGPPNLLIRGPMLQTAWNPRNHAAFSRLDCKNQSISTPSEPARIPASSDCLNLKCGAKCGAKGVAPRSASAITVSGVQRRHAPSRRGEGKRAVITEHRGVGNSTMLTNREQAKVGETFTIKFWAGCSPTKSLTCR